MQQADSRLQVGNNQIVIHLLRRGLRDRECFVCCYGMIYYRHIAEIANQIKVGVRSQKMSLADKDRLGVKDPVVLPEIYRIYLLQKYIGAIADLIQVEPERIHIGSGQC